MLLDDMTPMTEGMGAAYGDGWGGFFPDEGTTSYVGLGMHDDMPVVVVVARIDGQWTAEATDEEGYTTCFGWGNTPQQALDDMCDGPRG